MARINCALIILVAFFLSIAFAGTEELKEPAAPPAGAAAPVAVTTAAKSEGKGNPVNDLDTAAGHLYHGHYGHGHGFGHYGHGFGYGHGHGYHGHGWGWPKKVVYYWPVYSYGGYGGYGGYRGGFGGGYGGGYFG